jgi:peptidylprolyl isomerase
MSTSSSYAFLFLMVLSCLTLCSCCTENVQVAVPGDVVFVHYRGTLEDGTVFDSSFGRDPLQFTLGDGTMIAGFDRAVEGMAVGSIKTVTIPFDEAYGPYSEDLVIVVSRDVFQEDAVPEIGQRVRLSNGSMIMDMTVIALANGNVTLDGNLPLAGENLTFTLELVKIL